MGREEVCYFVYIHQSVFVLCSTQLHVGNFIEELLRTEQARVIKNANPENRLPYLARPSSSCQLRSAESIVVTPGQPFSKRISHVKLSKTPLW